MKYDACWRAFATKADEESLKELFVRAYGDLRAYGCKITVDTAVVEDAIQEVFFNLWKYKHNLNGEAKAVPYLFRSLRNEIVRIRKTRFPYQTLVDATALLVFLPNEMLDETLDAHEKEVVADALNSLPPRQKEILYLKFYENISYEDIAVILDIRYQSVINQSFRGITKLRKHASLKRSLLSD